MLDYRVISQKLLPSQNIMYNVHDLNGNLYLFINGSNIAKHQLFLLDFTCVRQARWKDCN